MALLRWFAALAGVAAVLGAMVSLSLPLALHVVDRTGMPIACGTGWHPEDYTARHVDSLNNQQHVLVGSQFVLTDYAGECTERVVNRRWLAAGVAGVGFALTLSVALVPYALTERLARRPAGTDRRVDSISSYAAW